MFILPSKKTVWK